MSIRPNRFPVVSSEVAELVATEDDAGLLKLIAIERDRNREWADAALMELYLRHLRGLYPVCHRICSMYLADESQAENLLNRTFWRVFRRAEKFDPVRAGCAGDAERTSAAVRCWMVRQARWLAKDIAESTAVRRSDEDGGSEAVEQVGREDGELPECSPEVFAAINRLPERERHIVLAFYFFTDADTHGPVPPNENIDVYCARRWGTTPANVRKIRSRALDMLREWLPPPASRAAVTR